MSVAAGQGHVLIRALLIRSLNPIVCTGLRLDSNSMASLNSMRIDRFHAGVYGRESYSILTGQSNIPTTRSASGSTIWPAPDDNATAYSALRAAGAWPYRA